MLVKSYTCKDSHESMFYITQYAGNYFDGKMLATTLVLPPEVNIRAWAFPQWITEMHVANNFRTQFYEFMNDGSA